MEKFPFGQPVTKVEQKDKSPKIVFILGVYASAVHAKWLSPEGKTLINALAVASEPSIFWRNDDDNKNTAKQIINRIQLPKEAGILIPADKKFNGPSGRALDEEYLTPLGINRDNCWLCDLIPYSILNPRQKLALQRNEYLFEKFKLIKPTIRSATKHDRTIDDRRRNEIVNELRQSKAKYLITLGDEPLINFIKDTPIKRLQDYSKYGNMHDVTIDGYKIKFIPLIHPRQAAKLGTHNLNWFGKHMVWKKSTAQIIKKLLTI